MRVSCSVLVSLIWLCSMIYPSQGGTVIAARCQDGIILASDSLPITSSSRTSKSPLIQTRGAQNFFKLSPNLIIGCLSTTSDFHDLFLALQREMTLYKHLLPDSFATAESEMSLKSIVHLARRLIYSSYPSCHILIAGYSTSSEKSSEYELYEILPGGSYSGHLECPSEYIVAGTGGNMVHAMLHDYYYSKREEPELSAHKEDSVEIPGFAPIKRSENLDSLKVTSIAVDSSKEIPTKAGIGVRVKDALSIVRRALMAAVSNDPLSGGKPTFLILQSNIKGSHSKYM